jgi:hypothetical protein
MPAAVTFVLYLLALVAFAVGACWPLLKREPFTPVNAIALGLTLVDVVWLVQSGQAAF